jgi:hypothetical protein
VLDLELIPEKIRITIIFLLTILAVITCTCSTELPLVEMKEGGMVFPGGAKEGGVFVEGELGMPIMGGGKKTGGQFDKDGYLVGKDGSLVS